MRRSRIIVVGLALSALAIVAQSSAATAAAGAAAEAVPRSSALDPSFDIDAHRGEELRIGSTWESSRFVGIVGGGGQGGAQNAARSIPMNPADVFSCNIQNNADHVLAELSTYEYSNGGEIFWPGGDVDLLCGTEPTSGFKHIRDRHQWSTPEHPNAWEDVRSALYRLTGSMPSEPWDFFMWEATNNTVGQSDIPVYVNTIAQKSCFHAPYRIFREDGTVVAEWTSNVILSRNNFVVISSFMSDRTGTHDCNRWSGE